MDEEEKTDLLEYLPEYLRGYHEIRAVLETENVELQKTEQAHAQCVEDRFMVSCGTYGIDRFEQMLKITPFVGEPLETRRLRAMSKWNNMVPYHFAYLESQLTMLCGRNGYRIHMDFAAQTMEIKVELAAKHMIEAVKEMLNAVIPCNLFVEVDLMYNQHKTLGKFTHRQLSDYTNKQLREDVIS